MNKDTQDFVNFIRMVLREYVVITGQGHNSNGFTLFTCFLAVDMWSAGVILLCMLSRRYPFFKAKDDLQALAQMMALFGSKQMERMASEIGKYSTVLNSTALERVCHIVAAVSFAYGDEAGAHISLSSDISLLTSVINLSRGNAIDLFPLLLISALYYML